MPKRFSLRKNKQPDIEYLGDEIPKSPTLKLLLKEHYFRVMPNHKHHRVLLWVTFLSIVFILSIQFAYPIDRALPFARIGDKGVGFIQREQLAKQLVDEFDKSQFKIEVGNKTFERPLKLAGAEPEIETMIEQLTSYSFWERFIPLSLLWQNATTEQLAVSFSLNEATKIATEAQAQVSYGPENAGITIKNGYIEATQARDGRTVTVQSIQDTLLQARYGIGQTTTLKPPSTVVKAGRSADDLAQVRSQAEQAVEKKITLTVESDSITPDRATIASWIVLPEDNKGVVTIALDQARIDAYVATLNQKYAISPGMVNVTVVNGREMGRSQAPSGRTIDGVALKSMLEKTLFETTPSKPIALNFVSVAPTIIYNNTYRASQEGLQSYINDVSINRNMRISIQQLDGDKWSASARATESLPSASTYKLFVALVLFERMDRGEINWNTSILDTNVTGCFERMVVASTNPCAQKFMSLFGGHAAINQFAYSKGFSKGTDFTNSTAVHTTAADLTKLMVELEQGTILSGAHRDKLLDALGRHPYQDGIPAGSKGKVNDKVGFLWDYVHDTAIVHHPKGTYVMTIMTKGQSYARIAEVTREIERIMYP